jgi:hypothetical protein
MARKSVVDAVEAYLADNWDACPVIGMNEGAETPELGTAFIIVQFPVVTTSRFAINEGYYREEGAIRLVIQTERGSGTDTPLQYADELAALFRYKSIGGVKTQTPSSPRLDDSNDQGAYFATSLVIPYTFDFTD